ncbi:Ohr family peroxiredoxin [Cupriavidus alkaliphilus]|uniref:Ohr subfamily peroxiredoxin n=1 Tax=Cupriavidus alkaliphilus TaxID=942866 RepID=A0A7W4VCD7_9BURK|nr:Ohr family peroxiredoxin [Cupriavidus alkaliphilus]MBB3009050.1 Ohr subfamily peroxiredoxin [Cupriavidus alkaliphilus]PVY79452.1 Ohr subfamily peroxiredoxin [Cupriavidus alkaliphilus]SCB23133.1 peroxiredoxin, Ohr subfamily [Cupriavidus alkaliphilus]
MANQKLQPPPLSLLDKYRGPDFDPLYTTAVTVTGGETGHGRASGVARSDDGNLVIDLRLPAALGGPGNGTNPEQLFAASYAACFHGALHLLAQRARLPIDNIAVEVEVAFGRDPVDGAYALSADVRVRMPGVARALAEELVRNTERFCPYVKMTRQGIASVVAVVD